MFFGISASLTEDGMNVVDLARAIEERGFESLFLSEHTHMPVQMKSPSALGGTPRDYALSFDPWISLAAAAGVTSRIRFGTGICLVTQRDPIVLAREIATLDVISGGRAMLGAGAGWNAEEMENHGTDPSVRWQVMRERILAMKEIWTHDEAEFHGTYVNFDPIYQWPKPVQKPHPPVLVGGSGPHVVRRVVSFGDGWMPTVATVGANFLERVADLQRLAHEAGRDPIPVTASGASSEPAVLEQYQAAGIVRCLLRLPAGTAAELLPVLDQYADVTRHFA